MDRSKYPPDWPEISLAVRRRARWRCERCHAPAGSWICRLEDNPAKFILLENVADEREARNLWLRYHKGTARKPVRVVLTVHHVGAVHPDGTPGDRRDKWDCRPENLQCLCQRCHLLADLDLHVAHARRTRHEQRTAGQASYLEDDDAQ